MAARLQLMCDVPSAEDAGREAHKCADDEKDRVNVIDEQIERWLRPMRVK
jgi:hypothetical protein